MRFLADSAGIITPFAPEASLPPPMNTQGPLGSLGLEKLLAGEFNARDNAWKFVMVITDGLEFVRGGPLAG